MAVLMVVPSLQSFSLMFEGMIWFAIPCALVITNDVMAYIFGMLLGKKIFKSNLIDISPKKTWEGYLIGGFVTVLSSVLWA